MWLLFRISHAVAVAKTLHLPLGECPDVRACGVTERGYRRGNGRAGEVFEDEPVHAGQMNIHSADAHVFISRCNRDCARSARPRA